jgi:methyltransferase
MELSTIVYLWFLAAVALGRLLELRYSRANQKRLEEAGSSRSPEPGYRWMVMFHAGVLAGSALEVVLLKRPFIPWLGMISFAAWLASNALRWWTIHTLGPRWNVNVMQISSLGVTITGPYRWVRHPNYTAVYLEMLALPLVHSAWIVASCGAILHAFILARRIRLEESVLMKDSSYRTAFAAKPRFIPISNG